VNLKNRLIIKIAQFTRKRNLERLDRFLRFIYNPDTRKKDFIERVIFINDDLLFKINTASFLEWSLFFYGGYEFFISKLFERFVYAGATVVDVGANIGIHSLKLGKLVGSSGSVYAFEPHPMIFQKLDENITLNRMFCIKPIPLGLASKSGEFFLHGFDENSSNQGTSFLTESDEGNQENLSNTYTVNVETLDNFIEYNKLDRLDLIKIDAEGFDLDVLMGSLKSIAQFKPVIIFEYCLKSDAKDKIELFDQVQQSLLSLRYNFYVIKYNYLVQFNKSELQGNVRILCLPSTMNSKD
jgi:FkbM family methyltransferase